MDYRECFGGPWPPARCYVLTVSGGVLQKVGPTAGGDIDGVAAYDLQVFVIGGSMEASYPAVPGLLVYVEASAAFSAGANLETLADGRVKAVVSGKAVLRALEGAGAAGQVVRAVFTSGR